MFHSSSLAGDVYIGTTNRSIGKMASIKLYSETVDRTIYYPTEWVWLGRPARILSSSKVGVISLTSYGDTDDNIVAVFASQV